MNSLPNSIKNYLFIANSADDYLQLCYELFLKKVAKGDLVVLLTSTIWDFTGLLKTINIEKTLLNNLIFMSYKSIEEITKKLFDLHKWSWYPTLVVVDLFNLVQLESSQTTASSTPMMQKVTLCVVALLTYLQSIVWQLERKNVSKTIQGLFILNTVGEDDFGHKHLQIINDLYFYKTKSYQDFKELSSAVLQEEE